MHCLLLILEWWILMMNFYLFYVQVLVVYLSFWLLLRGASSEAGYKIVSKGKPIKQDVLLRDIFLGYVEHRWSYFILRDMFQMYLFHDHNSPRYRLPETRKCFGNGKIKNDKNAIFRIWILNKCSQYSITKDRHIRLIVIWWN